MSEKKGGVELIERLLNPMWAHSNMPFESPQLEQEENLAAMRDAAKEIQRLLAIPDAAQERIRELERALQPFAEIAKEFTGQLSDDRTNTMHWAVPTVGQFRAALRALSTARPIPEKEESK